MKHTKMTAEEIERAVMREAGYVNLPLEQPEPPRNWTWTERELPNEPVKIVVPRRKPKQQEPETIAAKRTRIAKMYACLAFPNGIPESWVRV
jgi:hypothetical protein